jgi:hypothetical protein
MSLTLEEIDSSSDDELFRLLSKEIDRSILAERGSPQFVAQIRDLPVGLRAMAATYELDVSFALDDLGWHFGNWHNQELSEETLKGLEELGASDLAALFKQAFELAQSYWSELDGDGWMNWYHGSAFERAVAPLDKKSRAILDGKGGNIFKYWVDYARRHPERVGATEVA